MAEKKLITVVGATGAQGGGVARAILADPNSEFAVRAITRDVNSPAAQALARAGAEVVAGDLDQPATIHQAFEGAYGAYCVTFYWAHMSPEKEIGHVAVMAQAAASAKLQHVIWSTLEDTRRWIPLDDNRMPTLGGRFKVPHFDAKGESDHFFSDRGVPTTYLLTSFYWDNFIYFGMGPQPGPDGTLGITLPMGNAKLPGMSAEDIGCCAYGIFKRGTPLIGDTVGIAGEHLTGAEMAAGFSEVFGVPVRYNEIAPEVYRGFGSPGADDLGNMFQFNRDFSDYFCGIRDIDFSRGLNPRLQTFKQWLTENKDRIPMKRGAAGA